MTPCYSWLSSFYLNFRASYFLSKFCLIIKKQLLMVRTANSYLEKIYFKAILFGEDCAVQSLVYDKLFVMKPYLLI